MTSLEPLFAATSAAALGAADRVPVAAVVDTGRLPNVLHQVIEQVAADPAIAVTGLYALLEPEAVDLPSLRAQAVLPDGDFMAVDAVVLLTGQGGSADA